MDPSPIINLRKATGRNFNRFLLKHNPFPPIGIPNETILFTVDRESEIKRFEDAIAELSRTRQSNITVLVGEYGSGKSHLLKLFEQNVNQQLLSRDDGTLGVYIKTPGEEFRDFSLGFMEGIGNSLLTELSSSVVKSFIRLNQESALKIIYEASALESAKKDHFEVGDILVGSRYHDLFSLIRGSELRAVESPDIVAAFLALSHPEHNSKAWRWLLGESLTKAEKDLLGVEGLITDDREAYNALKYMITLLGSIGINHFFIAVDELERVAGLPEAKRTKFQNFLLEMINDHPTDISYYFAIAPFQWDKLSQEQTALVRRLSGNWHILEDFDSPKTRELLEKYLFYSRSEEFSSREAHSRFPKCEPSLCPFETEAVNTMQSVTEGLVSLTILLSRRLLEYVHDNYTTFESISPEMVSLVAEKEHIKRV